MFKIIVLLFHARLQDVFLSDNFFTFIRPKLHIFVSLLICILLILCKVGAYINPILPLTQLVQSVEHCLKLVADFA